jgi:hypothetical protein
MRNGFLLGLCFCAACGGNSGDPAPGRESAPVAQPVAQRAVLVQCGHGDALCPSVLGDGAARNACAPGRSVHLGFCSPLTVLYVKDGVDTGERCFYDDHGALVAALRDIDVVRHTCTFGPVTFEPPSCDTPLGYDVCATPSIE